MVKEGYFTQMWNYYLSAITTKYATFEGVATRREFWSFCFFYMLFKTPLIFLKEISIDFSNLTWLETAHWLILAYDIIFFIPFIAILARKMHDVGASAWLILTIIIPFCAVFDTSNITSKYNKTVRYSVKKRKKKFMNTYADVIKDYISTAQIPDCIFTGDKITPDILGKHKYYKSNNEEIPLVVIGKGSRSRFSGFGIVITDKSVSYALEKRFWQSIQSIFSIKPITNRIEWKDIEHLQLIDFFLHWKRWRIDYGLAINHRIHGLFSTPIAFFDLSDDTKVITFINGLSEALHDQGLLKDPPNS